MRKKIASILAMLAALALLQGQIPDAGRTPRQGGKADSANSGVEVEDAGPGVRCFSHLDNYLRVRADLKGRETVFHFSGMAYGVTPGDKRRELFAVEGFTIGRVMWDGEDGPYLLEKELLLWQDHRTGEILSKWRNPYTNKDVQVLHLGLDPINQRLVFPEEERSLLPMILPSQRLGKQVVWHRELFPNYPSPLPRRDYPHNSQSDTFQAGEFTQYIVEQSDLDDVHLDSVPAIFTFTEVLPWLPFMEMGDAPGNVILVCRGNKLAGGFQDLPEEIKDFTRQQFPAFITAPESYTEPNDTPWGSFKRQLDLIRAAQQEILDLMEEEYE